jgi:hypothetical protein
MKTQRTKLKGRKRWSGGMCLQSRCSPVEEPETCSEKRSNRRNMQRTCNGLNLLCESQDSNMCRLNGLDGGPGESRTPDQRFRNWAIIPQRVCFQCLQFGQCRAVLGLFGSRTCNRSCNAGRGWPSLLIINGSIYLTQINPSSSNCPLELKSCHEYIWQPHHQTTMWTYHRLGICLRCRRLG